MKKPLVSVNLGSFEVTVNYDLSLEDAIDAGNYETIRGPIEKLRWDHGRSGTQKKLLGTADLHVPSAKWRELSTVAAFHKSLLTQNIIPASLVELLAVGEQPPNLQVEDPIIAIASVSTPDQLANVIPIIGYYGRKRWLGYEALEFLWSPNCKILIIRS